MACRRTCDRWFRMIVWLGCLLVDVAWLHGEEPTRIRSEQLGPVEDFMTYIPLRIEWFVTEETCRCELIGDEQVVENVVLDHWNGQTLQVKWKQIPTSLKKKEVPLMRIYAPRVKSLGAETEQSVEIERIEAGNLVLFNRGTGLLRVNELVGDTLKLFLLGDGAIDLEQIDCRWVQAVNRKKGDIKLFGRANRASFLNEQAGVLNAAEMSAAYVQAIARGDGNIYCHAIERLEATVLSTGDIVYTGHPKILKKREGRGRIMRARDAL